MAARTMQDNTFFPPIHSSSAATATATAAVMPRSYQNNVCSTGLLPLLK